MMKRFFILVLIIGAISLYSCNGSESPEQSTHTGVVSNAVIPPTTLDGKPIPTQKTEKAPQNESGIDVNAKSDSKGVGEFKDVKISSNIDPDLAAKGKQIFQTSCTACHTATDQRLVGPGLKGITKIRTPEWIMNMITNPMNMTSHDPVAKELKSEFNNVQMTNQQVGNDGARAILEFLRQNDGVK